MSMEEKLIHDFLTLSDDKRREVIDFIEFLKDRNSKQLEITMNDIINENHKALEELSK